jgi:hypothetical protein
MDHNPAVCAVEHLLQWWNQQGTRVSPIQRTQLITAEGEGSHAARSRFWKGEMHHLATETGLCITGCHGPRGTRPWNTIAHRLVSSLSLHWRATPLMFLETGSALIAQTTTRQGVVVTALTDIHLSPTGIPLSDEAREALSFIRDDAHGEWNDLFLPDDVFPIETRALHVMRMEESLEHFFLLSLQDRWRLHGAEEPHHPRPCALAPGWLHDLSGDGQERVLSLRSSHACRSTCPACPGRSGNNCSSACLPILSSRRFGFSPCGAICATLVDSAQPSCSVCSRCSSDPSVHQERQRYG